jgi:hypothetical protein
VKGKSPELISNILLEKVSEAFTSIDIEAVNSIKAIAFFTLNRLRFFNTKEG